MKRAIFVLFLLSLGFIIYAQEQVDNSPQTSKTGVIFYSSTYDFGAGLCFFFGKSFELRTNIGTIYNLWQPSSDYARTWDSDNTYTINWMVEGLFETHPINNLNIGIGPAFGVETNTESTSYNSTETNGPYDLVADTITYRFGLILDMQYFVTKNVSAFLNTGIEVSSMGTNNKYTFPDGSVGQATSDINLRIGAHTPSFGVVLYF